LVFQKSPLIIEFEGFVLVICEHFEPLTKISFHPQNQH